LKVSRYSKHPQCGPDWIPLGRCRDQLGSHKKFRFKNKLVSLGSTVIDLCVSLFDWANFRRTKGAIKLHMILDHDGYLLEYALINKGRVSDVKVAQTLLLPSGTIVVYDRGYNEYRLFAQWTRMGVYFVTRMKENALYAVLEEKEVPQNRHVLLDQAIGLTGSKAMEKLSLYPPSGGCLRPGGR